ncbi:MAG: hypothetical protein R2708_26280 [Vicinamibacterales bacterium]
MSEWRSDPVTGNWTLVADDLPLARRDFVLDGGGRPLDVPCPLCEGREAAAGHEILAVRHGSAPDGPGWQLRVVPNRVPALRVEAGTADAHDGLLTHRPGLGAHEVVIESPHHDRSWFAMTADELALVLGAWRGRMSDLRHDSRLKAAVAFKNHGAEAAARLVHPHSQVIAMPLVPPALVRELEAARRHHTATGGCLFCTDRPGARGRRAGDWRGGRVPRTGAVCLADAVLEAWLLAGGGGTLGALDRRRRRTWPAWRPCCTGCSPAWPGSWNTRPSNAVLHSAPFDEPAGWRLSLAPGGRRGCCGRLMPSTSAPGCR